MENLTQKGAPIVSCASDNVCEVVQCGVCMKEVPASVAQSFEGIDYVHHFCGLECLGLWHGNLKITDVSIK
jgi:hypothetical protein